jgi:hypothetical protein
MRTRPDGAHAAPLGAVTSAVIKFATRDARKGGETMIQGLPPKMYLS